MLMTTAEVAKQSVEVKGMKRNLHGNPGRFHFLEAPEWCISACGPVAGTHIMRDCSSACDP